LLNSDELSQEVAECDTEEYRNCSDRNKRSRYHGYKGNQAMPRHRQDEYSREKKYEENSRYCKAELYKKNMSQGDVLIHGILDIFFVPRSQIPAFHMVWRIRENFQKLKQIRT
jgi:hypothetical protein